MLVKVGSTDVTTYFHLRLAADGTDATGLTITNIDLTYVRSREEPAAKVDATALADQDSAHGDNQAIEVDATNMPGVYRVDWPDAAFASGAAEVILTVKCATAFTESLCVQLVAFDPADTVRLGLTALPNAAAEASGGLPTLSAAQASNGTINANVHRWLTGTPNALVSGRVDASAGAVASDAITAAALAADAGTEIATAVWASGTRTITALDEDSVTLDLDATIRAAVGLTSANLDTQLDALPTAAENATAVWAAGTRTLSTLDEDSTTLDLDATIRAAVGMSSANLDTQISTIDDFLDTEVSAIKAKTDLIPGTQDGKTFAETILLMAAVLLGKASGLDTTTAVFRAINDSKDRVTATVDGDGNRSAVTLDAT